VADEENASPASFWSTVTWPVVEGLFCLVGVPLGFFVAGTLYDNLNIVYGAIVAGIMFAWAAPAYVLHRVLKAWAEFPTPRPWLARMKAAIRYLLTDS
jgi:hypothetical protein